MQPPMVIQSSRVYITQRGRDQLRRRGLTDAEIDMFERAQQSRLDARPFAYVSPVFKPNGMIGLVTRNGWKFDGRSAVRERVRVCKGKRS